MLTSSASIAAFAVVSVGLLILWSNPKRPVNKVVFSCSIHIALWLGAMHMSSTSASGLLWVRWTTSIAALIPLHFWLVKEAIASDFEELRARRFGRAAGWLLCTLMLAAICFTDFFIPPESTGQRRLYGVGYYGYIVGSLLLYFALAFDTFRKVETLSGGRRLELQVWLWGGCAGAATILGLMFLNVFVRLDVRLQPFVVLLYYAGTAYAITTHKVFDARQLLLIVFGKAALVGGVAGVAFGVLSVVTRAMPDAVGVLVTTAIGLGIATYGSKWLDQRLEFFPEATSARLAALSAAQRETRVGNLEAAFCTILKGWGQSERAVILSGATHPVFAGDLKAPWSERLISTMRQLRWATPERLARERVTPEREEVGRFLEEHGLGVLGVGEGPTLTVLVGVGVSASRRPYTYPQVTQLLELASIMESALERAHFSAKAQHSEQLATVGLLGANLAHEIRNPLVSIKTFVQLLPTHYADPAFREKFFRLIGDEVARIDQLTEQLLELASRRTYVAVALELHPVLRGSLELVAAKAADKRVQFLTAFEASPDVVHTDAGAAKQVMLNLCFNAIQAVEGQPDGRRWIKVGTRTTPGGVEVAVSDSGPGITEEVRPRLFQPFQTTKSSGFGLGLAICRDVLANLHASISVDPSVPGQGATFRVTFPCPASSS